MKVLLADDDDDLRGMLDEIFCEWGYDVMAVPDGKKAIGILEGDDPPRVAVLDWTMPEMDGLEVTKWLRSRESEHYTYIIMLTGRDDDEDVVTGLEAGADDYIKKPFNMEELKRRVETGVRVVEYEVKLAGKNDQLRHMERSLYQSQKMESIGTLAAGIAHEINTPIQFIGDNMKFVSDAAGDFLEVLAAYRDLAETGCVPGDEQVLKLQQLEQDADMVFLEAEIPKALQQSREGLDRVAEIIIAMKDFSHAGTGERADADINRAVDSAITVSRNEWKHVATLEADLDPTLPMVSCFVGDIKQAVLNVIVNAAHAIAEKQARAVGECEGIGRISVGTSFADGWVEIRVRDDGAGIVSAAQDKVFDPFFSTKDVGSGTGQGLSLAHASIVQKHEGELTFETEEGQGTTFIIRLPVQVGE